MCSYMIGLPITIRRDNNVSRTGKIIAIIPANHVTRAMKVYSIGLYSELQLSESMDDLVCAVEFTDDTVHHRIFISASACASNTVIDTSILNTLERCRETAATQMNMQSVLEWTRHIENVTENEIGSLRPYKTICERATEIYVDLCVSHEMLFGDEGLFSKQFDCLSFQYGFGDSAKTDLKKSRRLLSYAQLQQGFIKRPYTRRIDLLQLDWLLTLGAVIQHVADLQFSFDEVHVFDQFSISTQRFDWHTDYVNNHKVLKTAEYHNRITVVVLIYIDDVNDILSLENFNGIEMLGEQPQIYTKVGHGFVFPSACIHRSVNKFDEGNINKHCIKATYFFPG